MRSRAPYVETQYLIDHKVNTKLVNIASLIKTLTTVTFFDSVD